MKNIVLASGVTFWFPSKWNLKLLCPPEQGAHCYILCGQTSKVIPLVLVSDLAMDEKELEFISAFLPTVTL